MSLGNKTVSADVSLKSTLILLTPPDLKILQLLSTFKHHLIRIFDKLITNGRNPKSFVIGTIINRNLKPQDLGLLILWLLSL